MSTDRLFDPGPRLPPTPTFSAWVSTEIDLKFDVKRFIQDRLAEYLAYELDDHFYQYWEKPLNFLYQWIRNQVGVSTFWTAQGDVEESPGNVEIEFNDFTEDDAIDLHKSLGLNSEGTEHVL